MAVGDSQPTDVENAGDDQRLGVEHHIGQAEVAVADRQVGPFQRLRPRLGYFGQPLFNTSRVLLWLGLIHQVLLGDRCCLPALKIGPGEWLVLQLED